jgi:hypothetical protein
MAFTHYTAFTVQASQVLGTLTDFPTVLSFTDNRFKTTGNGGHVAGSSGFDLRPYSDSGLSSALTYELVTYSASSGQFEMWVKVPSMVVGYVIYLAYGDAALSSDGSSSATFSALKLAAHYKDGTTLSVADSTAIHTGTNVSATAIAGQIDGAIRFNGSSTYMYFDDTGQLDPGTGNYSYSFWMNWASAAGNGKFIAKDISGVGWSSDFVVGDGTFRVIANDGTNLYDAQFGTISTGVWTHIGVSVDRSAADAEVTVNGAVRGVTGNGGDLASVTGTLSNASVLTIGMRGHENAGAFWAGDIDELHYYATNKPLTWFAAEYNNQFAPGTFFSTGTEQAVGGGNIILMGEGLT